MKAALTKEDKESLRGIFRYIELRYDTGYFTHEDVRRHREAAEAARHVLSYQAERSQLQAPPSSGMAILGMQAAHNQLLDRLRWHTSMADRIAALLPEEEV
jgi:hypothetical protein